MNVESIANSQAGQLRGVMSQENELARQGRPAEQAQATDRTTARPDALQQKIIEARQTKNDEVQPDELLQNIKSLTDGGRYSVRFEMHRETNELIINLVEQKSGETIRQIPPDEILGLHKMLMDLRGNLVEMKS